MRTDETDEREEKESMKKDDSPSQLVQFRESARRRRRHFPNAQLVVRKAV